MTTLKFKNVFFHHFIDFYFTYYKWGIFMKLVFSIVNSDDAAAVSAALTENNFQVTKLATTGGFLKVGNTTFITGVEDNKVNDVIEIIRQKSNRRKQLVPNSAHMGIYSDLPLEVTVGGATIFVVDVDRFEKI